MTDEKKPAAKTRAAQKKAAPKEVLSIHEAMQKARIELCGAGISKDGQAPAAVGGYKFRGIDDIYNVIGPLMAKYGISMLPQVQNVEHTSFQSQRMRNGNPVAVNTQHYLVTVRYILTVDGDEDTFQVEVYGEASDTADKGMNKAMTSAYKNAVFQTFAPPLDGTPIDMDSESTEDPAGPPPRPNTQPKKEQVAPPADAPVDKSTGEVLVSAEDARSIQMAVKNAGIDETGFFAWIKVKKGAYDQIPAGKLERINETLKEKLREKTVADAKALAEQAAPAPAAPTDDDLDDDVPF